MRGGLATASATRTPEPRRPARVPFVAARLLPSLSWCSLLLVCLRLTPAAVRTAWSLSCLRSHLRAPLFVSAGWLPFAQPDAHALFGITCFVCFSLLPDQTLVVPPHTTRIIRITSTCKSNSSHLPRLPSPRHPLPPMRHCCALPPCPLVPSSQECCRQQAGVA